MKNDTKISIGLDIGTNSVGWAVVDDSNQLIKKNGKTLWGVRMFSEAQDASTRRQFRANRTRLQRRNQRIQWLREIFASEICNIDSTFYERLDDSFYKIDDKKNNNYYNLFNGTYTDKDFYSEYPTIYHLRKHLLESRKKEDIRFVFLAISHMVKYRGNFLYPGDSFSQNDDTIFNTMLEGYNELESQLQILFEEIDDNYFNSINLKIDTIDSLKDILQKNETKKYKKLKLKELFNCETKSLTNEYLIPLLVGTKVDMSKLSITKQNGYEKSEVICICENLDLLIDEVKDNIPECELLFNFVYVIKSVVDFVFINKLLKNDNNDKNSKQTSYLCDSMVNQYNNHLRDLKILKALIKKYLPHKYDECFRIHDPKIFNYPAYIGMNNVDSNMERFSHCKREDFYAYIKKLFEQIKADETKEYIEKSLISMENNEYLARQNSDQNGVIPMQLNLMELIEILNEQSKYYPFLNVTDEDGNSNKDKIVMIFKYKIDYYVGHLNQHSKTSWIIRSNEKITPWNYSKVINIDDTAKAFIEKMQNKCTYLKGINDYCLPKDSLIFTEYNCLSFLNKLNINGKIIPVEMKNDLFDNVFMKKKNPTKKDIINYLKSNYGNIVGDSLFSKDIPDFKCNMNSTIKFKEIFGDNYEENIDNIENIIKDIVVFEDKKILETRLVNLYKLDSEKIRKIKDLNYVGYGSLCKNLLCGIQIVNHLTGEIVCDLLNVMRSTNYNLQEVLYNEEYKLIDIIAEYNKENMVETKENELDDFIDNNIYISPIMKRPMIQSYHIISEVEKILNRKIDKYYIECTRTNNSEKKPTMSRYYDLKNLYSSSIDICKELNVDLKNLSKELEDNKDKLRSDKIYLYFTQLGRCMYTLQPIDFDDLIYNDKYDIDHIYPQSMIKDDSLSNRVLTLKTKNNLKQDNFIFELEGFLNPNAYKYYKLLLDKKLISEEKYKRLTKKELSSSEIDSFINRQIVATNQSVKGLIDILKLYKKVDSNNIVFSKAENVTLVRRYFDIPKSRIANNFHHAHDAYLNVVIGRALNEYYKMINFVTKNDYYRLKSNNISINPLQILQKNRTINGKTIWNRNDDIDLIKKNIFERFDILETTMTTNSSIMYNKTTILPASNGELVPIKSKGLLSNTEKYGGITSNSFSRMVIIKCPKGYILEAIPMRYDKKIEEYLVSIGYKNYEIVNNNIKSNVVVVDNSLKYGITGKNGDMYLIKNACDRFFSFNIITILKKIEKYNDNINNNIKCTIINDKVVLSPSKNKYCRERSINKTEICYLINDLINKYDKDIYSFSNINTIRLCLKKTYIEELPISDLLYLSIELLKLLKTNERTTADLTLIGLSKRSGTLLLSKKLKPSMKFISESVTGYYSKVMFEVPSDGI